MPFVALPNAVKLEVLWLFEGSKPMATVLHALRSVVTGGGFSVLEVQTLATEVFNQVASPQGWANDMTSKMTLTAVRCTDATSATGPQATSLGAAVICRGAIDALSPNNASVVTLHTSVRSRSGRGRIFLPGLSKASIDAQGQLIPAWIAAQLASTSDLDAVLIAGTPSMHLAVGSKKLGFALQVVSSSMKPLVRSQRRRELDH